MAEDWAVKHAGMELAALAAGINRRWKVCQQRRVELTPGKLGAEPIGVYAGQDGAEPGGDKVARQPSRLQSPEREEWRPAERWQDAFPVGPDVLEEEIAEREVTYAGVLVA